MLILRAYDAVRKRFHWVAEVSSTSDRELQGLDPEKPYTYCRICGAVYQSPIFYEPDAVKDRKEWSHKHAYAHTTIEHEYLRDSNLWLMPEAQHRLAALGIISITDMSLNDEVKHAGETAPRTYS